MSRRRRDYAFEERCQRLADTRHVSVQPTVSILGAVPMLVSAAFAIGASFLITWFDAAEQAIQRFRRDL